MAWFRECLPWFGASLAVAIFVRVTGLVTDFRLGLIFSALVALCWLNKKIWTGIFVLILWVITETVIQPSFVVGPDFQYTASSRMTSLALTRDQIIGDTMAEYDKEHRTICLRVHDSVVQANLRDLEIEINRTLDPRIGGLEVGDPKRKVAEVELAIRSLGIQKDFNDCLGKDYIERHSFPIVEKARAVAEAVAHSDLSLPTSHDNMIWFYVLGIAGVIGLLTGLWKSPGWGLLAFIVAAFLIQLLRGEFGWIKDSLPTSISPPTTSSPAPSISVTASNPGDLGVLLKAEEGERVTINSVRDDSARSVFYALPKCVGKRIHTEVIGGPWDADWPVVQQWLEDGTYLDFRDVPAPYFREPKLTGYSHGKIPVVPLRDLGTRLEGGGRVAIFQTATLALWCGPIV